MLLSQVLLGRDIDVWVPEGTGAATPASWDKRLASASMVHDLLHGNICLEALRLPPYFSVLYLYPGFMLARTLRSDTCAGCPNPAAWTALEYSLGNPRIYVGGDMFQPITSTNDPIFWNHHSFVDLVWENWRVIRQSRAARETQYPPNNPSCSSAAHYGDNTMQPFFPMVNKDGLSNAYTDEDRCYLSVCKGNRCLQVQTPTPVTRPPITNTAPAGPAQKTFFNPLRRRWADRTLTTYNHNAECKDTEENCCIWARKGHCTDAQYAAYMLKNCSRACGQCGNTKEGDCRPNPELVDNAATRRKEIVDQTQTARILTKAAAYGRAKAIAPRSAMKRICSRIVPELVDNAATRRKEIVDQTQTARILTKAAAYGRAKAIAPRSAMKRICSRIVPELVDNAATRRKEIVDQTQTARILTKAAAYGRAKAIAPRSAMKRICSRIVPELVDNAATRRKEIVDQTQTARILTKAAAYGRAKAIAPRSAMKRICSRIVPELVDNAATRRKEIVDQTQTARILTKAAAYGRAKAIAPMSAMQRICSRIVPELVDNAATRRKEIVDQTQTARILTKAAAYGRAKAIAPMSAMQRICSRIVPELVDNAATRRKEIVDQTQVFRGKFTASEFECKDIDDNCCIWARKGYCTDERYAAYMLKNCSRACGQCGNTKEGDCRPNPECKDLDENCCTWARNGYCTLNANYMKVYCRQACGLCGNSNKGDCRPQSGCSNRHTMCCFWASNGQCFTRPRFLLVICSQACGVCGYAMGQVCITQSVCGYVFCGLPRRISRNRRPVSRFVASPHRLQLRRQLSPVSLAKGPSTQISSAPASATGRSLLLRTRNNLTKWHRQRRRGPRKPSGMAVFAN
ncbi:hypothetical protein RB195_012207 [Necator americanus]|uniref:ShKT domain-containing protein n=1 Tax=Necator americanus TaxID=51031 RepID=A0ABR1D605_NECAM